MKRLFLLLLTTLFFSIYAKADDFTTYSVDGSSYSLNLTYQTAALTGTSVANLIVPSSIKYNDKSYTVKAIGMEACEGNTKLITVSLPNTIIGIGNEAFSGCTNLKSVNIPDNAILHGGTFARCKSLTAITIPAGATFSTTGGVFDGSDFSECTSLKTANVYCTMIRKNSFSGCTSLSSVTLGSNLNVIEENAFMGCSALKTINIPSGVKTISENTFSNCTSLTSVGIPSGLTAIEKNAFNSCSSLTSITIPNGVKKIEENTFYGCSSLRTVSIGTGVTSIGNYAFKECIGLTSVTLPQNLTYIGESAFFGCTAMASISFPNSLTTIGSWAFYNCNSLKSLIIPKNVSSVGGSVFYGCNSLNKVTFLCSTVGSWFNSNKFIQEVSFGDNVTTIEYNAFIGCSAITSIVIPDNVTCIGNYAFGSCSGLAKLVIGKGINKIETNTFENCTNLCSVELHCQYISPCFRDNKAIQNVILGDEVLEIEEQAFYKCTGLTSVKIGKKLTTIGRWAFGGCAFTEISIPDNVVTINQNAFSGCKSLSTVSLPNNLTKIDDNLFSGCTSLTSIKLPEKITSIGRYAFQASGLTSITIPSGVTEIVNCAFYGCTALNSVTSLILEPFTIDRNVFDREYLRFTSATLYVPKGTKEKYQATSAWNMFSTINELAPADDVTITAKSYSRVYGDANPTFGYEVTSGTITSGTPTITCSATKTSPVGTYDIVIAKGTVSNSSVNLVKGTLTITKAPLTISAGNYTKVEGEANPTFTPTFSGFKNSETKSVLTTQPTVTTTATTSSPVGTYPVTVSGAAAQNYSFNYVNGTLTVTAKPVSTEIAINATNFPDENFRNYLLSQSYGSDGVITSEEIKSIKTIDVGRKEISSLKGIGYFTALTSLSCSTNELTSLDVSKNTALTSLTCDNNQMTALDVSKNTSLQRLHCNYNQLSTLDVSKNTALTELWCYKNQLTALDVSKNTALIYLYCYNNQLTALDVSKNTALIYLYCYNNQLTALDVSKNTVLVDLTCSTNQLTALDVSKNTSLIYLTCNNNQLTALDVSKNSALKYLYCYSNKLTSLDVSKNIALTTLYCYRNKIKDTAMNSLIASLPDAENGKFYVMSTYSNEGNVCTKKQVAAAKQKGWTPYLASGSPYEGSEDSDLPGDLSGDGQVNGTDIVALVSIILGQQAMSAAADVNGDGQVNGTDIVALVDIILNGSSSVKQMMPTHGVQDNDKQVRLDVADDLRVNGQRMELTMTLDNPKMDVTLVQCDMALPQGIKLLADECRLTERTQGSDHQIYVGGTESQRRLLLTSTRNGLIEGSEGGIVRLAFEVDESFGGGDIVLNNILCVSHEQQEAHAAPCCVSLAGGADGIRIVENGHWKMDNGDVIYNLNGQRLSAPRSGVNIIGGHKVVIH